MKRTFAFIPAALWAFIILWLCLLPGNDLPKWPFLETIYIDKWVHITLFFILSLMLLAGKTWYIKRYPANTAQWTLTGIASAYGILIEILQLTLTTTRQFELADIAADTIGALLGVLLFRYLRKKKMFLPKP